MRRRGALAIVAMVVFYSVVATLALALVFGSLYAFIQGLVGLVYGIAGIVSGILIASMLLPPEMPFEPPGPELEPTRHARLFAQLDELGRAMRERGPSRVFIHVDVMAGVSERRPNPESDKQRLLIVGLPLFTLLTVHELRAVLVHELGHFHAGDTRLGPFIYEARGSIHRLAVYFDTTSSARLFFQRPLLRFGEWFVNYTSALARAQELEADAASIRVCGPLALGEALCKIVTAGPAWADYWRTQIVPALNAGYAPPILEGWRRYLDSATARRAHERELERHLHAPAVHDFDSHPPLGERLDAFEQALASGVPFPPDRDESAAVALLGDEAELARLEAQLLEHVCGHERAAKLERIDWAELHRRLWLPQWRAWVEEHAVALAELSPAGLPEARVSTLHDRVFGPGLTRIGESSADALAPMLARALCVLLDREGFELRMGAGNQPAFVRGEHRIEPFEELSTVVEDELEREQWRRRWDEVGLGDCPLARTPVPVGDAPA